MFLITKYGFEKLKNDLVLIEHEEKQAIEAVVIARGYGDFSENAELEAANNWLERCRTKKNVCQQNLLNAQIFNSDNADKSIVSFGACVSVEDENENVVQYKIVSELESDVKEGKISLKSPIASALMGKKIGTECSIKVPSGDKFLTILNIDYSWL